MLIPELGTTSGHAGANKPKGRIATRRSASRLAPTAMIAGVLLVCGSAAAQDQQPPVPPKPAAQPDDETRERLDEQEKKIDELNSRINDIKPGNDQFLISGFIWSGLSVPQHGDSTFDAALKPVFLWKISDDLLAAASIEFEIADNNTEANIEYANIDWNANDWLTLRAGVIISPMSTFQQNLHPQWINKLPDNPLFASDGGLAPEKSMGFEARGGVWTEVGKFTYSAFVSNGPSLDTTTGQLNLTEFSDVNNNKAVGGRLGYQPVTELEFAYALQYNDVSPSDSGLGSIYLLLHDLSVSYVAEKDSLHGRIDARVEFMYADFQKDVDLGSGPFNNDRSGGYAQVAYRPTKEGTSIKNFEGVIRYDFLNQPSGAPDPSDEDRWTLGLNYWISPRTVAKVAYEFDHVKDPTQNRQSNNMFMLQFATGF